MYHPMTSDKKDSEVHFCRILLENLCHLRHHLQCLLLCDALIWIHYAFIQNPSIIRSVVGNSKEFQCGFTIPFIIDDLG